MKRRHRKALEERLEAILDFLTDISFTLNKIAEILSHAPNDVVLDVHPHKEPVMAKQKLSFKIKASKGAKQSPAQPVTITGPVDLTFQFVDDHGAVVPGISAANVTSTFDSDNPVVSFTQVDALNYKASIPAGTTGTANLTLTASVKSPAAGPFTASLAATLDIPPTPPVPVDVVIIITPSP